MGLKNSQQVIIENLEKEKSCFESLALKLKQQKIAIKNQNEEQVLQIIEEKNILIKNFKKFEKNIENQLQLLSPEDIKSLLKQGETLKESIENLLGEIILSEEECEKEISSKMQEVEKKIIGLQKGKNITKGYRGYQKI